MISDSIKIDAVNRILSAVGDSPVVTLENPTNVNVINAVAELDRANRRIQSKGWSFNESLDYVLNTDQNTGYISWSSTFLRIISTDGTKLVRRGGYLYNATKQTFSFPSSIKVNAIILTDLVEMPEPMLNYIIAVASETFQSKYLGDPNLSQSLAQERAEAWADLQNFEMESNQFNALTNDPDILAITGGLQ